MVACLVRIVAVPPESAGSFTDHRGALSSCSRTASGADSGNRVTSRASSSDRIASGASSFSGSGFADHEESATPRLPG
jgi:hypothetical protein